MTQIADKQTENVTRYEGAHYQQGFLAFAKSQIQQAQVNNDRPLKIFRRLTVVSKIDFENDNWACSFDIFEMLFVYR